jgi:hypothetical protein
VQAAIRIAHQAGCCCQKERINWKVQSRENRGGSYLFILLLLLKLEENIASLDSVFRQPELAYECFYTFVRPYSLLLTFSDWVSERIDSRSFILSRLYLGLPAGIVQSRWRLATLEGNKG